MTCPHFHSWLQAQLDREAYEDAQAERQLRDCPECRALDAAVQSLRVALLELTPPAPPADLSRRIVNQVLAAQRHTRRRQATAWAALAASLLLTMGMTWAWPRWFPSQSADSGNAESIPSRQETPTPPLRLRESVAQASYAVASLTSQAADETMEHTRLLLPSVPAGSLDVAAAPALETPRQSLREAGLGVSEGLEPLADSARRAVGLFLRELPVDKGAPALDVK